MVSQRRTFFLPFLLLSLGPLLAAGARRTRAAKNKPDTLPASNATAVPQGGTAAVDKAATAFSLYPVAYSNCQTTCTSRGLGYINSGMASKALCARIDSTGTYYGTWTGGSCFYQRASNGYYMSSAYYCACTSPGTSLSWGPSADCVTGSSAAATSPAVCRYQRYGGGDYQMGWITGSTCYTANVAFGPGGSNMNSASGLGTSPYYVQALCKSGATPWCPPCQVYSSSAGKCVADASKNGNQCCTNGSCSNGYCKNIRFSTRVGTCTGSYLDNCDGWNSGGLCSGCTVKAMYNVATRAIPYLHPATDYPTRDARITMAAVATYWSLSEGVFNKMANLDGYNNCETCASGNNYQAPLESCNTLACAASPCRKGRQCTWQVGIGAAQVVNSGYGSNIDYVCTSSLAPGLNEFAPLSNLPCVEETALKAYGYKLTLSQILTNAANAAAVSPSSVLARTTNCPVSDASCRQRAGTNPAITQCQCQLDRKSWLLRDPAVSITYSAYEWFGDRGVSYGTTSALPDIASLKTIYQCLSPP